MAVPTVMTDLSTTEASNSPQGSETPIVLDNNIRATQSILRHGDAKGADIASATTTDIGAATGKFVDVTGTTTITGLGTIAAGIERVVRFTGALTLTHNGTSLILPSAANITTAANDTAIFRSLGSGNWLCISYKKASGFGAASGANSDITSLTAVTTISGLSDAKVASSPILARNFGYGIFGLTYANSGAQDIAWAAGGAMDNTNSYFMTATALTKKADTAWAVGTAAGSLDTGVVGNSDYYWWLIARSDTGVVDYLSSLSSTAPTMPANYDKKRLIGWHKRSAGTVVTFKTYELSGGGLGFAWLVPPSDISLSNTLTTTARTDALSVPQNFSVVASLNVFSNDAAAGYRIFISNPDITDTAVDITTPIANAGAATSSGVGSFVSVRTSATGTIRSRASLATVDSYAVSTASFEWARRN